MKGGLIMPKKLTQEEFIERVNKAVGENKYTVLSQYQGKRYPITLRCNEHNVEFTASAECFMRGSTDVRSSCPKCSEIQKEKELENCRIHLKCAYCGKEFVRSKSRIENSKSGLFFCCREHKDLAQKLDSGEQFEAIRPIHYGEKINDYRQKAFDTYEHKCSVCGWNEDERILEVHHINSNRENNEIDNLVILCPTCHRKITLHYYKLIDRELLVPIE